MSLSAATIRKIKRRHAGFPILIFSIVVFTSLSISHPAISNTSGKSALKQYNRSCHGLLKSAEELVSALDDLIDSDSGKIRLESAAIERVEKKLDEFWNSMDEFDMNLEDLNDHYRKMGNIPAKWQKRYDHLNRSICDINESNFDDLFYQAIRVERQEVTGISPEPILNLKNKISSFVSPGIRMTGTSSLALKYKSMKGPAISRIDWKDGDTSGFSEAVSRFGKSRGKELTPSDYIQSGHEMIAQKAAELAYDPLGIYNYVRNTISVDTYPGFRKHPSALVNGGSANAWDTAALLMSLLRASGIDCRLAHGTVIIPVDLALAWLGYHYPEDGDPAEIIARCNDLTAFLNTVFPASGGNAFAQSIVENYGDPPRWIRLADHAFVLANIDYIPSRGARQNAQSSFRNSPVGPLSGSSTKPQTNDPPSDYQGDTWIPLDACLKGMDTHCAESDNPLYDLQLTGENGILNLNFLSDIRIDDPVELLLDEFLNHLPEESDGESSPLFDCTIGAKPRYETCEYLPNTLPYTVAVETFEHIENEQAYIDNGEQLPKLVVSVSDVHLPGFNPNEYFAAPVSRSFDLAELASNRLTFRFVPDDLEYWELILADETFHHIYEVPGLEVRPQLVLSGVFDADGDGFDDWDSGYPEPVIQGVDYWIYFSLQDTYGNWYSIENKIPAGEFFTIAVTAGTIDSATDLNIVDEFNIGLIQSGNSVPKLFEKQLNEELFGQYLQLQGRHYFKQLMYSEEIMTGMFRGRMIRDTSIARIGMTFGEIVYIGGEVASISGAASFCDVDHRLVGAQIEDPSLADAFWEYLGYTASTGEHELFFRETIDHTALVSTSRIFQMAGAAGDVLYNIPAQTEPPFIDPFNPAMFTDPPGYPGLSAQLSQQLNAHNRNGYAVMVPSHFYTLGGTAGISSWTGTGYQLAKGTESSFMIFGVLDDAPTGCGREMGGALGLAGSPWFFDEIFGMEFEAFVMQQTNLTKSQKYAAFRYQWEDEYQHWITLGIAKEFRWRFRTYTLKTHHYRLLCQTANCIAGRLWVKVLIWNGQGSLDGISDHLVAVFRSDSEIECINLFNKEYDPTFENPYYPRPEPRQSLGNETLIEWFDYDPWRPGSELPANLPSWNWELGLPNFSSTLWLGAFIGSNTASSTLYRSINPRVWHQWNTPTPSPSPTPTVTDTPFPDPSPTPVRRNKKYRDTPIPTRTPTYTYTPGFTSTPTPQPPTSQPIGMNHCDGFIAAKNNPLSFPTSSDYLNKWTFARQITRQFTTINDAAMAAIPTCHPRNWDTNGFEPNLGTILFGQNYQIDEEFLNWHFDTYHPEYGPGRGIELHDTSINCPHYYLEGYLSYCLEQETPLPTPRGRCPIPGAVIKVSHKHVPDPGVEYSFLGQTFSRMIQDPEDPDFQIAYFLFDTLGQFGYFQVQPYKVDAEGRITHALPWSTSPDEPGTINDIYISEEQWGDPVKVTETGEVALETFAESCLESPGDNAFLGEESFAPNHFRIDGLNHHAFFDTGAGLFDLFSGKLLYELPLLSRPGDGGNTLDLKIVYSSSIYPYVSEGSIETWVKESHLGVGWEMHLGKIILSKGELPVVYGPDNSTRTMFCENEEFNFGPYRSTDLWRLEFSNGVNLHDDNVTAVFWTDEGWKFVCGIKIETSLGLCPFEECDNFVYTWLVTEIVPPDDAQPMTTINYDIYDDYYGKVKTAPNQEHDLIRRLWAISSIDHRFGPTGFLISFDHSNYSDTPGELDSPKCLEMVRVNGFPYAQMIYNSNFSGHKLLEKLMFLSGVGSNLSWCFEYYPGSGSADTFDRWRGLLKSVMIPEGGRFDFEYSIRNFQTRLYGNDFPDYKAVQFQDISISKIKKTGTDYPPPFDDQIAVYTIEIPEYADEGDFTRVQIFNGNPDIQPVPADQDRRYYFHHYLTGAEESMIGELDRFILHDNLSRLAFSTSYGYEFRRLSIAPMHPCVDFLPQVALPSVIEDTEHPVSDSQTVRILLTATLYDQPGSDPDQYLYANPVQVEIKEKIGSADWKTLGKMEYENTAFRVPTFKENNILRLPSKIRSFFNPVDFKETLLEFDTVSHPGRILSIRINGTLETQYHYDDYGNVGRVVFPTGNTTQMIWWDVGGGRDLVVSRGILSEKFDFNPVNGEISALEDANGFVTTLDYDGIGRLTGYNLPMGREIQIYYPNPNTTTISRGPIQARSIVDAMGYPIQTAWKADQGTGGYNHADTVWDGLGRIRYKGLPSLSPGTQNPGYRMESYDVFNRLVQLNGPESISLSTVFSPGSAAVTDGEGNETVYIHDGLGRLTQVMLPFVTGLSNITEYRYDLRGNLSEVLQSHQPETDTQIRKYRYDHFDRLVETVDPESGMTRLDFDETTGYLTQITFSDGSSFVSPPENYDGLDRLKQRDYYSPEGILTQRLMYFYDGEDVPEYDYDDPAQYYENSTGKLTGILARRWNGSEMETESVVTWPKYDETGQPLEKTLLLERGVNTITARIAVEYENKIGRVERIRCFRSINDLDPFLQLIYLYKDHASDSAPATLESVILSVDGQVDRIIGSDFIHHCSGSIENFIRGNNIQSLFEFDDAHRLSRLSCSGITDFSYEYDNVSNIVGIQSAHSGYSDQYTYVYDSWYRLIGAELEFEGAVWSDEYQIDSYGNIVNQIRRNDGEITFDQGYTFSPGRWVMQFGGDNGYELKNQAWKWTGDKWKAVETDPSPEPRAGHAMLYDKMRQRSILFGGLTDAGLSDEMWEFNGSCWQRRSHETGPSARTGHKMVYDSSETRVLLFGGQNDSGYCADIWEWDGIKWKLITENSVPLYRSGFDLVYDSFADCVVMYGGCDQETVYSDTLIWDGSDWSSVANEEPPGRYEHAMVYDPANNHILLFGGYSNEGFLADSWLWNGHDWTLLTGQSPAARSGHILVYDELDGEIVMHGGEDDTGTLGDTWVFAETWTQVAIGSPLLRKNHAGCYTGFTGLNRPDGFLYDARGNRLEDGTHRYYYDVMNRLEKVEDQQTRSVLAEYTYDGTGKRVYASDGTGGIGDCFYFYLGERPLMEWTSGGDAGVYVYAEGRRLAKVTVDPDRGIPEISYYHTDHLGSTVAITDAGGDGIWPESGIHRYHPYGEDVE
ncbi:hypothetical protein JXA40_07920, partial [bacterium]|nr:hypothetical protein [candidate division CSSED10-310 bacterium]